MSRMITVFAVLLLLLAGFVALHAGNIEDPPIIEDPPDPPLFGQHSNYVVYVDIQSDTGAVRGTKPDSVLLVPVAMYASNTTTEEGLTMTDFINSVTYDDEKLEFIGLTDGVWDAESITVTSRAGVDDLDTLEIEASADSWTFNYEEWDTIYYMEFRILCVEDYQQTYNLGITSTDYQRNWVIVDWNGEQYDNFADDDGFVLFDQNYSYGMHAETAEGFLGAEIRVPVLMDSLNYITDQIVNYFHFNSTDFYLSEVEPGNLTSNWHFHGAASDGDSILVYFLEFGDGPVGPIEEPDTAYVLVFKSYPSADPGDESEVDFIPNADQHVSAGACNSIYDLVASGTEDGHFAVPDYSLGVTLDFVGTDKEPGDYDTLIVYIQNTFPLGLKAENPPTETGGDLQLLLGHTDLMTYEGVVSVNPKVDLDIHAPNAEHVKIWLNPPDAEEGWFDSTSTPVELCQIEFQIADGGSLGPDPDLGIDLVDVWGSYTTNAIDTTGSDTLVIGDGITSTGDEVDLQAWQIWTADATGYYSVDVPVRMNAIAETDSVYVHITYSHPNLCIHQLTSNQTGLAMTSTYGNVYLKGGNLDISAGSDILLGTIRFGSRVPGTIVRAITVDEAYVLDGDDTYHTSITDNGDLTITTDVNHQCPNINDRKIAGEILPREFVLHQNYPNPFNPTTKIKFDLPKDEWVRLEIYNVLGQKVKTLLNTPMEAGYHEVEWNANADNSSGIYFYTLQAGDFADSKKMMLLK